MKVNSGVETETEKDLRGGGGGKTEPDTLRGKPARPPAPHARKLRRSVSSLALLQSRGLCLLGARTAGQFRKIIRRTVQWGSAGRSKACELLAPVPSPASLTNF